ncbi:MAG: SulP family inorganic anion transporter [Actinobacteria bacterium]|nr:SulP family inorganic anion transporter [Actinomycetota bacterium]MCB9389085.1 SulP family inorganic anion transporter [Acidimicrobiia bacterium]
MPHRFSRPSAVELRRRIPSPRFGDVVAGVSVGMVLIPQAVAYAEIAGVPPRYGLLAAGIPLLVAAIFASSPYLQTGPVAMTSLLTFGALAPLAVVQSGQYVELAALLAIVVGAVRLIVGLTRSGAVAYLMSQPVLLGFTVGSGILIAASQIPAVGDVTATGGDPLAKGIDALTQWRDWSGEGAVIAVLTVVAIRGAKLINPVLPGILIAIGGALIWSSMAHYDGTTVGAIDVGFPSLHLGLPWAKLPDVVLPGVIIALVGFAEPAAIARSYAAKERSRWDPDREFVSQGAANLTSGLVGGVPIGGSFARTSINHLAGAKTQWSGAITGMVVLAALPVVHVLSSLPRAALAGVVIAGVMSLIQFRPFLDMWRQSRLQAVVAVTTLIATLTMSPRVDHAVVLGVVLAIAVHLWRESSAVIDIERCPDGVIQLRPVGVFWFGSAPRLSAALDDLIAQFPTAERIDVNLSGIGRLDYAGAHALKETIDHARSAGFAVEVSNVPEHAIRILSAVNVIDMRLP